MGNNPVTSALRGVEYLIKGDGNEISPDLKLPDNEKYFGFVNVILSVYFCRILISAMQIQQYRSYFIAKVSDRES